MKHIFTWTLALILCIGSASGLAEESSISYPLEGNVKLTWWVPLNSNITATSKDMNELPYAKALREQTGADIEFIHPTVGQEKEQFNLMIASNKLTDIIEGSWLGWYSAGMDVAIENGLCYALNDNLEDWAPDYKKYLDEYPDVDKMSKTDSGKYFGFGFMLIDDILKSSSGPYIRADWLEALGLEKPETIDDWTNVLKAFRDNYNATAPLCGEGSGMNMFWNDAIIGAYGVNRAFYHEGDTVKFGPLEEGYKQFLAQMANWYAEGLINPNFITDGYNERDALVLNEQTGITFGYAQSGLNRLMTALKEANPDASMAPLSYPVLEKGQRPMFGQKQFCVSASPTTVINPASENLETAVKVLNFMYSDAGYMLNNFGTEGVSYNLVDGYPQMSDLVMKPQDMSIGQAWAQHARACYNGPFEQSAKFMEQYQTTDLLRSSLSIWSATDTDKYVIPMVTLTSDESKRYTQIMNDVEAIINEWVCNAIMGINDVNNYDAEVVTQLKDSGIDEALAIQQAAFDRFNAR